MAYDANDPADQAIVQGLIDAALEEAREAHEADIAGLKRKNTDLSNQIKRLRAGGDDVHTAEITRLEGELEEVSGKLRTAETNLREVNRKLTAAERERDGFRQSAETETAFSRNMLVESGLTSALVEANVAPQFMEAAKAMLGKAVTVKVDGDNRTPVVGDKSLGDYVKEWAASEAGKHFVTAPGNGGGGANGSPQGGGGTKKLADMTEKERLEMARTNPTGWQALLASEGNQPAA